MTTIHDSAAERLTLDSCEMCSRRLVASERVEVTGTFHVRDADPTLAGPALITATYCTTCAPKEFPR